MYKHRELDRGRTAVADVNAQYGGTLVASAAVNVGAMHGDRAWPSEHVAMM